MLVLGGAVIHVSANRSFDKAAAELSSATQDARDAADGLDVVADDAGDAVAASEAIVGSAADDLIDVGARTALADAGSRHAGVASMRPGARLSTGPSTELPEKPLWTWELLEATPTLEATAAELTEFAGELDADETAIQDAEAALVGSAVALYASAPAAAAALEAANVSAVNYVVLDFRDARDAVAGQTAVGSGAVDAFRTYAEKAATLKASAQTELAEKAGPLLSTRLEIEAFARSIAGGVVLDFDWAPIVNNIGGSAGMGGTATWVAMRGRFLDDHAVRFGGGELALRRRAGARGPRGRPRHHCEMQRHVRLDERSRQRTVGDGVGDQHGPHRRRKRRAGLRVSARRTDRSGGRLPLARSDPRGAAAAHSRTPARRASW